MIKVERAIESYLLLILGKLTGWNWPVGGNGPGDPVYLKAEQQAELAAEGIRKLASFLPAEAAQKALAAVERFPRGEQPAAEELMLNVGSLGGSLHHGSGGAPGCCVMINGHLVCVRAEAVKASGA
jgi:hypothetical protein